MTDYKISLRRALLACFLCAVAGLAFAADAVLKPVPQPDTKKLPADQAKEIADARTEFDKVRTGIFGDRLALAYAQIGAQYLKYGFTDAAAVAFYDATQLSPQDGRWLYVSGQIARQEKKDADAKTYFQNALALDNYPPIRYRLADTLTEMGDLDGARKVLLDGIAANNKDATMFAMLGRLEIRQHRYADAIEHLQQALKLEPPANALYKDLADAYTGQGDKNAAASNLAKAGNVPPSVNDPIIAGIYATKPAQGPASSPLAQAQQLEDQQQFVLARDSVEVALKTDPNDLSALSMAARLDALLGHKQLAQDEASRASKIKPDGAQENLTQGMVFEFGGEESRAVSYYQRAIRIDPNLAQARLLLGNSLMRAGKYSDAAEQYRQLAALHTAGADSDARIAAALVAQGKCREALNGLNSTLAQRARDGDLMQVFVRVASTCREATAQERGMALDYGQVLYRERPNATDTTALALAQAASGKFDDAQKTQAEAIFDAERARDEARAKWYRDVMHQYASKQLPDKPWPADHPYFKPAKLTPVAATTTK